MNWYIEALKKYAVFSERSRRMEYWLFVLISTVITIILSVIDVALGLVNPETGMGVLSVIYSLAVLVPSLAVAVRRLHDTNRSGWWLLMLLVPLVGIIVVTIFLVLDSSAGDNQYGPNPKGT
jgi:uncharacterized membrane protein YhaH (DUF805 family)